ncbi:MAG: hypothetical protein MJY44_03875 [Bacteroidales bacterium]|nr:hypothetical protein [Bacteroidales bacterium]
METEEQYPLDPEKVYISTDVLTLDCEDGPKTLKMGVWINYDPVRIHRMIIREKVLQVDQYEVLNPLVSKLRRADPEYFRRFMGLRMVIDFPGYDTGVVAKIPYENDPVGFYKWWRKGRHEDKVHLNAAYQIMLFQKVAMMAPGVVLKKDLEFIKQ